MTKVTIEKRGKVALLTLANPPVNALSVAMVAHLNAALTDLEADDGVHCIVITGSEKVFCAGGVAKEAADATYMDVYRENFIGATWGRLALCRKPVIAAVSGLALAGGCELALMADIIVAAENAKFGQPEIAIATIPGSGGTQRLTRIMGKAKAMKMILTGWTIDATEAERVGLVSDVVPAVDLVPTAMKIAERIASMSLPALMLAKEAVLRAEETTLSQGIQFERRLFHSTFALEDRREGMQAFLEKRAPDFKNR
jgi:enoyl-CoA hydratase